MRGVYYPFRHDSTMNRHMEVGGSLTPSVNGFGNELHAHRFKANLLCTPTAMPGNQIQGFRTTGQSMPKPSTARAGYRGAYR